MYIVKSTGKPLKMPQDAKLIQKWIDSGVIKEEKQEHETKELKRTRKTKNV